MTRKRAARSPLASIPGTQEETRASEGRELAGRRNVNARWVAFGVILLAAACGGGGGGGSDGIGLEDLNKDGQVLVLCFGDSITRAVCDRESESALPPR